MENIKEIIPPFLDKSIKVKSSPKKEPKKILDTKERLPKVNRVVSCIFCDQERTLNPDQYQAYYDFWGSEEKINKEFFCKPCDVKMKENILTFWFINSPQSKKLWNNLSACVESFKMSKKSQEDIFQLQNMTTHFLSAVKIKADSVEFVTGNGQIEKILIKNIPFIGTLAFVFNNQENKILCL